MSRFAHLAQVAGLCLVSALAACGDAGSDGSAMIDGVLDRRAEVPPASANAVDLVAPEVEIPAGSERMYCLYLQHDGPDLAVNALSTFQGPGGHHIALVQGKTDRPVGTLEDCTSAESIETMIPVLIPLPLPARHAVRIRSGQRFVLQFHYINVNAAPILVSDVARLEVIDESDVDHWVSTFATNSGLIDVPARSRGETEWDCAVEEPLEVLLVGGHMHERGTSFSLEVVREGAPEMLFSVPTWVPDFRDLPPILPLFEDPEVIPADTVLRTRCEWENESDEPVGFPEEMCASFGYIKSRDGYFCSAEE
ncbi:MAG: hypothetical protein AAF436_09730 [Myxococcota bacterium]